MPAVLSIIAHKEVRFIYPLLPALHILAAEPLVSFFLPAITSPSNVHLPRRLILLFLVLVNIFVAYYTTLIHASGPTEVISYLRERHEAHQDGFGASLAPHPFYGEPYGSTHHAAKTMSVGFLMPCHSTPWRSHFVFPSIEAWALSCEPPVGLNETEKKVYLDEADQFYADPADFLQHHMSGGLWHVPRRPSYMSTLPPRSPPTAYYSHQKAHPLKEPLYHEWPDYLVFFAQLEPTIRTTLRSSSYGECWRTWNTAWHDDWRRKGDIVVWCLDPNEQQEWRKIQHRQHSERREQQLDRVISRFEKQKKKTGSSWFNIFRKSTTALSTSTTITTQKQSWPWPFSSSKKPSTLLPSWLTNPWDTKRGHHHYIPKLVQDYLLPPKRSRLDPRSWFSSSSSFSLPWPFSSSSSSSSSWWPGSGKNSKKRPVSTNERDLWE
jgi:GPI mannosyltransferase 3